MARGGRLLSFGAFGAFARAMAGSAAASARGSAAATAAATASSASSDGAHRLSVPFVAQSLLVDGAKAIQKQLVGPAVGPTAGSLYAPQYGSQYGSLGGATLAADAFGAEMDLSFHGASRVQAGAANLELEEYGMGGGGGTSRRTLRDIIWDEGSGQGSARLEVLVQRAKERQAAQSLHAKGRKGTAQDGAAAAASAHSGAATAAHSSGTDSSALAGASALPGVAEDDEWGTATASGPAAAAAASASASRAGAGGGPRLALVNGSIQIIKESVIVPTGMSHQDPAYYSGLELVDAGAGADRVITSASFQKDRSKPDKWTAADTERFYVGLRTCGTDFSLLQAMFPERSRRQLKHKFNREQRCHPGLVTAALRLSLPLPLDAMLAAAKLSIERDETAKRARRKALGAESDSDSDAYDEFSATAAAKSSGTAAAANEEDEWGMAPVAAQSMSAGDAENEEAHGFEASEAAEGQGDIKSFAIAAAAPSSSSLSARGGGAKIKLDPSIALAEVTAAHRVAASKAVSDITALAANASQHASAILEAASSAAGGDDDDRRSVLSGMTADSEFDAALLDNELLKAEPQERVSALMRITAQQRPESGKGAAKGAKRKRGAGADSAKGAKRRRVAAGDADYASSDTDADSVPRSKQQSRGRRGAAAGAAGSVPAKPKGRKLKDSASEHIDEGTDALDVMAQSLAFIRRQNELHAAEQALDDAEADTEADAAADVEFSGPPAAKEAEAEADAESEVEYMHVPQLEEGEGAEEQAGEGAADEFGSFLRGLIRPSSSSSSAAAAAASLAAAPRPRPTRSVSKSAAAVVESDSEPDEQAAAGATRKAGNGGKARFARRSTQGK
jgi:hypothetical protein